MEHVASPCQCAKWSLKQRQWVYRGEGNASVVLALPQVRDATYQIIRLPRLAVTKGWLCYQAKT